MSDNKVISNIPNTLEFEGIENITKFKYRKTLPLYPKPGTFYWVEDEVDGEPKWGLWYATNLHTDGGNNLVRLDSNVYEFVVRDDDDNYIRINDKDVLDRQEIYLIIGKYDGITTIELDGHKVFHISSESENRGLATVEATVEYVSDSNNMFYVSQAKDFWTVGKSLGDIKEGTKSSELKNLTITDILDKIIYPTIQPEVIEPSVKLQLKDYKDYQVLSILDGEGSDFIDDWNKELFKSEIEKYVECDRGKLTYPTKSGNNFYAGEPTEPYELKSDTKNDGSSISLDKLYYYWVGVKFETGEEPLDNIGNRAKIKDSCDCESESGCENCLFPQFQEQTVYSNVQTFSLVYPIYVNYKQLNVLSELVVDYNDPENNTVYVEIPAEMDGHSGYTQSENTPLKACIEIPNHLDFEMYQFNELTGEYDIDVKGNMHNPGDNWRITPGVEYHRFIRSNKEKKETGYDTHTTPVKYKITIKRIAQ